MRVSVTCRFWLVVREGRFRFEASHAFLGLSFRSARRRAMDWLQNIISVFLKISRSLTMSLGLCDAMSTYTWSFLPRRWNVAPGAPAVVSEMVGLCSGCHPRHDLFDQQPTIYSSTAIERSRLQWQDLRCICPPVCIENFSACTAEKTV